MNRINSLLALAAGLSLAACAPAHKTVTLRADARLLGGGESVAKIEAPGDWFQSVRKADRATLSAPDNFSSITFSIESVAVDAARCPEFAQRAVGDLAKNPANAPEIVSSPESPEVVDYKMTVVARPAGPFNRFVQGRAICRNGALAVVTCSTGINKKDSVGAQCEKALASLTIENLPAVAPAPAAAPAPEAKPAEPPAAQPAAPAPAPEAAPAPAPVAPAPEAPAATPPASK